MMTVFSALHGLLFETLRKQIALSVVSTPVCFRFLVTGNFNLTKGQVVTLSTALLQYSMCLIVLVGRQCKAFHGQDNVRHK